MQNKHERGDSFVKRKKAQADLWSSSYRIGICSGYSDIYGFLLSGVLKNVKRKKMMTQKKTVLKIVSRERERITIIEIVTSIKFRILFLFFLFNLFDKLLTFGQFGLTKSKISFWLTIYLLFFSKKYNFNRNGFK